MEILRDSNRSHRWDCLACQHNFARNISVTLLGHRWHTFSHRFAPASLRSPHYTCFFRSVSLNSLHRVLYFFFCTKFAKRHQYCLRKDFSGAFPRPIRERCVVLFVPRGVLVTTEISWFVLLALLRCRCHTFDFPAKLTCLSVLPPLQQSWTTSTERCKPWILQQPG